MKKYGKYERQPEVAPANKSKVKSTLLQTYLTSLLCMVLCVSMFFGTSYAWFTSEVQNTGNEIYVGTLKVGLYKMKNDSLVSLAGNDANSEKLFNSDIRWEPGYTTLETIKVVNKGDLAFKYVLSFTEGSVAANASGTASGLEEIAQHFEVWVFRHYNRTYAKPSSYEDMTKTEGWTMAGTLDELLSGTPVLQGNMNTVRKDDLAEGVTAPTVPGLADSVATEDTFTIALHMKKDTDNVDLMGQKLGLTVKLIAYQKTQEDDAFGSYDRLAVTAADLKDALEEGGRVTLVSDIKLTEGITVPAGKTVTLDLNGHSLTGEYSGADHYAMFTVPHGASLTVEGSGTVSAATKATEGNRSLAIFQNAGQLTLNGGTYNLTDSSEGLQWIIAAIVDNRTKSADCETKLTINGGEYSVGGNAINLFRNYPQQGGSATLIINGGKFNANAGQATTYIWNQEAGTYLGELYFNGGTYDSKVVYEDYNGQSDIHIKEGVTIKGYSGNS